MIYISHHHADHHIGLIEILQHRSTVTPQTPLLLLIPPGIETHLDYYNKNFEDLSKTYTVVRTKNLVRREARELNLCKSALLHDLTVLEVDHCYGSCAVVFDFYIGQSGMERFKLAYSGDARPSQEFAKKALSCDLLIHEATFDHRDKESALEKKHSTTDEAIKIARNMGAKFTILTHFSQRETLIHRNSPLPITGAIISPST
jgi:ribonuclease Z